TSTCRFARRSKSWQAYWADLPATPPTCRPWLHSRSCWAVAAMHSRNVPALRLDGFDGEWETTTLGELGSFKSGVGFPERDQGGGAGLPFYTVSDLSASGNELQLRSANHYATEEQIVRN